MPFAGVPLVRPFSDNRMVCQTVRGDTHSAAVGGSAPNVCGVPITHIVTQPPNTPPYPGRAIVALHALPLLLKARFESACPKRTAPIPR